jgi:hypothetical protein
MISLSCVVADLGSNLFNSHNDPSTHGPAIGEKIIIAQII